MARTLFVSITETAEELEKRLKANSTGSGKERLLMLYWLKRGEVKGRKELAKRLHRDEATITRWVSLYKKGGVKALLKMSHPPGNKAIVPAEIVERLKEKLQQPQGFKSYVEVREWLEKDAGVKAAYKTVHKLVRYRLKAKLKVPRPSNKKQHPQAEEHFKKTYH
ncbi:helix-turn-helix domain-containing protein [[Phormidium] sp. LEGE 05292]|uniref:helix-turn-helix domain-containing protein n=1 Tax=[Phormidium] sp. LEGE 05292 TaxID=767427 RepID=UPI001D13438C|nr:helix-turn-helix domain-containing protein [Phormidium sp. LEGE 05292]